MVLINLPKNLKTIVKRYFFAFFYISSAKETDTGFTQDIPLK